MRLVVWCRRSGLTDGASLAQQMLCSQRDFCVQFLGRITHAILELSSTQFINVGSLRL